MRLLKLIGIGVVGAAVVVFIFAIFIMKHNHVVMERDESGGISYSVDDGLVFHEAEACAQHCQRRTEWNLQNTVEIRAGQGVSASDVQKLEKAMMQHLVYPRSLVRPNSGIINP